MRKTATHRAGQRRSNFISRFLWRCAGANVEILESKTTEHAKYTSIGMAIIVTAILAGFSGAYAIHTVFQLYWVSVPFGLFWGGTIFNLDRLVVLSIRKQGKISSELLTAAPRIAFAVVLGVIVAVPLELKIFEEEVQREVALYWAGQMDRDWQNRLNEMTLDDVSKRDALQTFAASRMKTLEAAQAHTGYLSCVARRDKAIATRDGQRNQLIAEQAVLEKIQIDMVRESAGDIGGRSSGEGKFYNFLAERERDSKTKEAIYQSRLRGLQRENDELTQRCFAMVEPARALLAETQAELKSARLRIAASITENDNARRRVHFRDAKDATLLDRLIALRRIALSSSELAGRGSGVPTAADPMGALPAVSTPAADQMEADVANSVIFMVMLLIVLVELSPVIVKLFVSRGSYDVALDEVIKTEIYQAEMDGERSRLKIEADEPALE